MLNRITLILSFLVMGPLLSPRLSAKQVDQGTPKPTQKRLLSVEEWKTLDISCKRGLDFLISQQQKDGSFPTLPIGQPGVTALVTLAFAAHGHLPGEGPYGKELSKAIDYILATQRDNGLIYDHAVGGNGPLQPHPMEHATGVAGAYCHAISGLALSELYGMPNEHTQRLKGAIEKGIQATLTMQKWRKNRQDRGGWRYLHQFELTSSDLSLAGWNISFLRSAKNAGFDVSEKAIREGVEYVLRCYNPKKRAFQYKLQPTNRQNRAMAGVGILALAHAGKHKRPEAKTAALWVLKRGFQEYNQVRPADQGRYAGERYHYGVFHCSLAMYQMGGRYWKEFFSPTSKTLLENQNEDGSWDPESLHDGQFGNSYTTALVVLALGAPNQLLPIYQR